MIGARPSTTPTGTTLTDDELRRGPYVGANAPTVLWVPALGVEADLPMRPRLTVGRVGVDVELPHVSVSRHHCNVERYGAALKFIDTGSKNGLSVRAAARPDADADRVDVAVISAGDTGLRVGRLYVVALTQPMIESLRALRFLLGYGDGALVALVTEVARGRNCVVLGPDDRGREDVARALMHASTRTASRRALTRDAMPTGESAVRAWADAAAGGTVCLDGRALAQMTDRDRTLLVELVGADARAITTVAVCDDIDGARHLLGAALFTRMQFTHVPSLRARCHAGELRTMIDHLFAEYRSVHRVDGIGPRVSIQPAVLERYPWPFEFNELRACVLCLIAELDGVSVRRLAEERGIDRSSLARVIERWQTGDEGKRPKDDVIRALVGAAAMVA